jgi:polyferredoxin
LWLRYDFYCINYYDFKNYIDSVIVRIPLFFITTLGDFILIAFVVFDKVPALFFK